MSFARLCAVLLFAVPACVTPAVCNNSSKSASAGKRTVQVEACSALTRVRNVDVDKCASRLFVGTECSRWLRRQDTYKMQAKGEAEGFLFKGVGLRGS